MLELTEDQSRALDEIVSWRQASRGGFFSLVGPAGSGKTTVMQHLVDRVQFGLLTAMTGKAALRLGECVPGRVTSTLHSQLYFPPEPNRPLRFERLKLPGSSAIIVDETSMCSPQVYEDLKTWTTQKVSVLLVGDEFQLPPVVSERRDIEKYGEDFSVFKHVSGARLQTVLRSVGGVLRAATIVRETQHLCRESHLDDQGGYEYVEDASPMDRAVEDYLADPVDHALVTWRNEARMEANRRIRVALGRGGPLPDAGEPVLVRKNGQGYANGEIVECGGWETGPVIGASKFSGAPGMPTMWMTVPGRGKILATVSGGGEDPDDPKFFDGTPAWVPDWKKFHMDLRYMDLPEPTPLTFGYALTAHACVHPDTIVETPSGLKYIKKIATSGQIATPTGVKHYKNLVTNPVGKMLRIRTKEGYTLDVTPDHGVFTWDGNQYSRIEAGAVRPGERIQFRLGATCGPSVLRGLPPAASHANRTLDSRAVAYRIPSVVDGDVAEFFGMFVADGTLFDDGNGFRLIKSHRDVVLRFKYLAESIFGLTMKVANTDRYDESVTGVEGFSVHVGRWLGKIGGMSPKEKDVPECILESPLAIQARFLRGLFEDGTVNLAKQTGLVDRIEWSTCRESLATAVHVMLLRFGIVASRNTLNKGGKKQYPIYIYGANARRFKDAIGFVSKWKQDRLVRRESLYRETRYVAPFNRSEIDLVRPILTDGERSNLVARKTLSRHVMYCALARGPSRDMQTLIDEKLKWHHSKIVSVEQIADAPSMCVEVPDEGRFLQNGSPQSNCQGSEFRRVSIFLDDWDVRSGNFNKMTTLPTGESVSFAARWAYTSQTRARARATMIIGG